MLGNLLLGLPMMLVCVFVQALLLMAAVRFYRRHDQLLSTSSFWGSAAVVTGVMLLLILGNILQIALWALLFMLLREFAQFSEAFYHSAVNFATLGYGDVVMSARNRLLGPLEAINGALMVGVSTATLLVVFQNALRVRAHGDNSTT